MLRTIVGKNLKSWEECLPFIEFAYNRCIHSTTSFSPFEIVYGFNPLTPLDMLSLPVNEQGSLDGKKKADLVKLIHEKAKAHIEKKNEQYASHANKGRRRIVFEPGDWVWLHLRKERFPAQRKSKLQPRGDGPFQVMERINDNAYKLDLPGEYGVSATFNVSDLSYFDAGADSRSNPFQEGGNDMNRGTITASEDNTNIRVEPLQVPVGPITRQRAQRIREAMAGLAQSFVTSCSSQVEHTPETPMGFTGEGSKLFHLIYISSE